jgi:hypothetical protein
MVYQFVFLSIDIGEKKEHNSHFYQECTFVNIHPGIVCAILKNIRDSHKSYEHLHHNKSAGNGKTSSGAEEFKFQQKNKIKI